MQMSIKWHKECFNNQKLSLERLRKQAKELHNRIVRDTVELVTYEEQITLAELKGKSGFDKDKFNKKK